MQFTPLTTAAAPDITEMYHMCFKDLYEKYHDDTTSPYMENINQIQQKINEPYSTFYLITESTTIGLFRLIENPISSMARISPLMILPKFQNQHYAQTALKNIELEFSNIKTFQIDTIKQETKLVHLYTKCGYQIVSDKVIHLQDNMDLILLSKTNPYFKA